MAKTFKGRPVVAGSVTARALVSHGGFNTLASFQKSLLAKKTTAVCSDQNNADLYGKVMTGTALCLPQTIGSTTGGMVLHTDDFLAYVRDGMTITVQADGTVTVED